jgi:hypothetical protein
MHWGEPERMAADLAAFTEEIGASRCAVKDLTCRPHRWRVMP